MIQGFPSPTQLCVIACHISLSPRQLKHRSLHYRRGAQRLVCLLTAPEKPTESLKYYTEMIPNFVRHFSAYLIPLTHSLCYFQIMFRAQTFYRYHKHIHLKKKKKFKCHSEISWITPLFYTLSNKRKLISNIKHNIRTSWFLVSSSKICDCLEKFRTS